jgi:hypothetical protein
MSTVRDLINDITGGFQNIGRGFQRAYYDLMDARLEDVGITLMAMAILASIPLTIYGIRSWMRARARSAPQNISVASGPPQINIEQSGREGVQL